MNFEQDRILSKSVSDLYRLYWEAFENMQNCLDNQEVRNSGIGVPLYIDNAGYFTDSWFSISNFPCKWTLSFKLLWQLL